MMKDKLTSSRWHVMPEVIKVGISAWPIVFAAVVAQVFKAYATWRVERVSSSSYSHTRMALES